MRFSFINLLCFLFTVNCLLGSSNSHSIGLYEDSVRLFSGVKMYIQFKYNKMRNTLTKYYKQFTGDKTVEDESVFDGINGFENNEELQATFKKLLEMFKENNMMKDFDLNENTEGQPEKTVENELGSSDKNSIENEKEGL